MVSAIFYSERRTETRMVSSVPFYVPQGHWQSIKINRGFGYSEKQSVRSARRSFVRIHAVKSQNKSHKFAKLRQPCYFLNEVVASLEKKCWRGRQSGEGETSRDLRCTITPYRTQRGELCGFSAEQTLPQLAPVRRRCQRHLNGNCLGIRLYLSRESTRLLTKNLRLRRQVF